VEVGEGVEAGLSAGGIQTTAATQEQQQQQQEEEEVVVVVVAADAATRRKGAGGNEDYHHPLLAVQGALITLLPAACGCWMMGLVSCCLLWCCHCEEVQEAGGVRGECW
jgi:hypothetical protein